MNTNAFCDQTGYFVTDMFTNSKKSFNRKYLSVIERVSLIYLWHKFSRINKVLKIAPDEINKVIIIAPDPDSMIQINFDESGY